MTSLEEMLLVRGMARSGVTTPPAEFASMLGAARIEVLYE